MPWPSGRYRQPGVAAGLPPGAHPFPAAHGGHLRWVARWSRLASDAPRLSFCSQVGEGHRVAPGLGQPMATEAEGVRPGPQPREIRPLAEPPGCFHQAAQMPGHPSDIEILHPIKAPVEGASRVGRLGGVLGNVVGHCPGAGRWRLQVITTIIVTEGNMLLSAGDVPERRSDCPNGRHRGNRPGRARSQLTRPIESRRQGWRRRP